MPAKTYTHLAAIYSHLMRGVDYEYWAKYISQISREVKEKEIYALELACGIGEIASELEQKFKYYVATDMSLPMLIHNRNRNINAVCCNVLSLPFKSKFNFIFSTFDSVNYLTTKQKFLKMLSEVNSCLMPDGIFTFDVSLENNSIRYQKYLNRKGKLDGISYKQKSKYMRSERVHYNIFEIKFANGKTVEEIHKQKIYHFEEYFELIDRSDFYVYRCYDAFSTNNASSNSERAQFVLKKKR